MLRPPLFYLKGENMLKKEITFKDYNGVVRTENHYFNLSKAELMEMEMSISGGFVEMVNRIVEAQDYPSLARIFKEFIMKSYGVKSDDGRRFIKSDELSTAFSQTEAYTELYMELATDTKSAVEFLNGIVPEDISKASADKIQALLK